MINKGALATYAQYNEDLVLRALLSGVKDGYYVDIGANDPDEDSVTRLFYEAGWTGINVEPIKKQFELFKTKRPKDVNLCLGIGDKKKKLLFREYIGVSGHSTFSKKYMTDESKNLPFVDYEVEVITLRDLFTQHAPRNKVNFLKIDVEGLEYEVIRGNDWHKYRPSVICIESNHQEDGKNWEAILTESGYALFIFDGLNSYYIAKEAWDLTDGYAERIVQLSHDALSQYQKVAWMEDSEQLILLQDEKNRLEAKLNIYETRLRETSMWNQPLRKRIKLAIKGLTVDWIRYKKDQP